MNFVCDALNNYALLTALPSFIPSGLPVPQSRNDSHEPVVQMFRIRCGERCFGDSQSSDVSEYLSVYVKYLSCNLDDRLSRNRAALREPDEHREVLSF